jgi:hypothetical protein
VCAFFPSLWKQDRFLIEGFPYCRYFLSGCVFPSGDAALLLGVVPINATSILRRLKSGKPIYGVIPDFNAGPQTLMKHHADDDIATCAAKVKLYGSMVFILESL